MINTREVLDLLPHPFSIKNSQSNYVYCNPIARSYLGLTKEQSDSGECSELDVKSSLSECYELFRFEDQEILHDRNNHHKYIGIFPYADKKRLIFYDKKIISLSNSDEDKRKYILCSGQEITSLGLIDCSNFVKNEIEIFNRKVPNYFNMKLQNNIPLFNLGERETEVLFLLLRGYSAKEQGILLKISKRTVESHINNIKSKMGCFSKREIFAKALDHGLQNFIPLTFFMRNS